MLKNTLKIQLISILIVLFSCLMMIGVYCDDCSGEIELTFSELGIKSVEEMEIDLKPLRKPMFYSYSGSVSSVNFGEQLSGNSLSVYNYLKNIKTNTKSMSMLLNTAITFKSKTSAPTETELKPVYAEITRFTQMAVDAYSRDYPENFWLDIDNSVYNFTYWGNPVSDGYQWKITLLTYTPATKTEYASSLSAHEYKFNKTVEIFKVSGDTTYEKVKSIYTAICSSTVYKEQKYCYDAYGSLVNGYAVCSGYAKAFKMICDRENIPCVLVSGESVDNNGKRDSHMWNLVKMDDGKWYCVDTTWGDSDKVIYDYLLTGTDEKLSVLNNRTFGASHIPSGDFSETGVFSFKYPTASKTAYDINWTPPTATPLPTATPIPTPTPVPVENPEPGDANRDGKINAEDALVVLRVASRLLDNSKGYYDFGDMQQDGIFTAEDALLILQLSAKIS